MKLDIKAPTEKEYRLAKQRFSEGYKYLQPKKYIEENKLKGKIHKFALKEVINPIFLSEREIKERGFKIATIHDAIVEGTLSNRVQTDGLTMAEFRYLVLNGYFENSNPGIRMFKHDREIVMQYENNMELLSELPEKQEKENTKNHKTLAQLRTKNRKVGKHL